MKASRTWLAGPSATFVLVLVSTACAALLLGYDFLLARPVYRRLAALRSETAQRERSLVLGARLVGAHPRVLARVRAHDAASLSRLGITNPAVELITSAARTHRLELELVEPGLVETLGPRRLAPVTLHLSGSYADFMAWLRALEGAHILATVDQVRAEATLRGRHDFQVALTIYTYAAGG